MNSLYAGVAALDMTAVGPSRVTCWSEWVGDCKEIKCGNCKASVLVTDYFCHNCGRGIKPKPCIHPVQDDDEHLLPQENPIDPQLIVETDKDHWQVMRVECPECHKRSSPKTRSYFCIAEWNDMSPFPSEEWQEKWVESRIKHHQNQK